MFVCFEHWLDKQTQKLDTNIDTNIEIEGSITCKHWSILPDFLVANVETETKIGKFIGLLSIYITKNQQLAILLNLSITHIRYGIFI